MPQIDQQFVGHRFPPFDVHVTECGIRAFTLATEEVDVEGMPRGDPQLGEPDTLVVPATYFFCLEMAGPRPNALIDLLGLDPHRTLHGEQTFRYHRMAYAGDTLRFEQVISRIEEKKKGALLCVTRMTRITNQDDELVAEVAHTLVVVVEQGPNP